jgi:hypothetical protein
MSFQDRTIEGVKTPTVAGNPESKAKDRLSIPATPAPNEPPPQPDFEAD